MSSLFGAKKTSAQPAISSFSVQTAVQGLPIPIVWGRTRISGNLIYYTDFASIPQYAASRSGKGSVLGGGSGGGKGGGGVTSYNYSAAVAIALCEGPISGVQQVWNNKTAQDLGSLNLTVLNGAYTQSAWGYTASLHRDQALTYRGLAYVAAGPLQLGGSAQLPNLAYEVTGGVSFAVQGLPDADPSAVITDLLTNPNYGVGFPLSRIGDLSVYTAYCRATGMLVSPAITSLTDAQTFCKTIIEATNSDALWSQGQLRIVPRGDQDITAGVAVKTSETHSVPDNGTLVLSIAGNFVADLGVVNAASGQPLTKITSGQLASGQYSTPTPGTYTFAGADADKQVVVNFTFAEPASYTAPSAPLYAFGDDDYVPNGSQPVDIVRSAPQAAKNSVVVNYFDRNNAYAMTPTPAAKDDASIASYGLQQDSIRDYHFFCYAQAAIMSAQLALGRNLVRNSYTFTVGQKYILLDPTDIVSLTDAATGLKDQMVRIKEITENSDLSLTMLAEDYLIGSAHAPIYGSEPNAGYTPDYNQAPGYINAPVIFEPPSTLTGGSNEVWIAVSGSSALWGGCEVFVSYDNVTYALVEQVVGGARQGYLTHPLAASTASPDTTNTLSVSIAEVPGAELTSGTLADATALASLCYVGGELLAYQTATLTALGNYDLTTLVRGAYGTPVSAHASGSSFARLDSQIVKVPYNKAQVGGAIFLKFVSFNLWGRGGQSLADVQPYEYVFGGGQPPGIITGLKLSMAQSGLSATLLASWAPDALSATYQAQTSLDNGATWATVYDGEQANLRLDGLKAAPLTFRVRGVTSSGVVGVWTSSAAQPPTMTSAGIGYSNFLTYKDLDPFLVDTALSHDLEADLGELATFVATVNLSSANILASQKATGAAAAAIQIASGAVPSLASDFTAKSSGIFQQVSQLTATVVKNAAQAAADALALGGKIDKLESSFQDATSAFNTGISVAQADINGSSALQRDDIAAGAALNADAGELAQFVAAVQTGQASAIKARQSTSSLAAIVTQTYANATKADAVAFDQKTLAASIAGSLSHINDTLIVQVAADKALASRAFSLESAVNDNGTGLQATYNEVVATSVIVGDPVSGNSALSSRLATQAASIGGNASAISQLQTTSADRDRTIASLAQTVQSNFDNANSSISNVANTVSSQGSTLSSLTGTVQSNYSALNSAIGNVSSALGATNNNVASNTTSISTLANQYGSLSQSLQTVSAQSAAGTASGQIGFTAQSAPQGVTARFALTISATGQQPASGGLYFDLAGGQVNAILDASTFTVQNSATRAVPFGIDASGYLYLQNITYVKSIIKSVVTVNGVPPMVLDFMNGSITIYDGS